MRLRYHISSLISASLAIILVYPLFTYILYDECSRDVRGEHASAKYTMRNKETLKKFLELKWCIF